MPPRHDSPPATPCPFQTYATAPADACVATSRRLPVSPSTLRFPLVGIASEEEEEESNAHEVFDEFLEELLCLFHVIQFVCDYCADELSC